MLSRTPPSINCAWVPPTSGTPVSLHVPTASSHGLSSTISGPVTVNLAGSKAPGKDDVVRAA
ncbi:Hypothetical protein AJAP_21850 [Amycolatopsis japonica]|uniref:Uncharacterized protein n=1 Tax=Amycolatopsis japonica TaxID=208439 RepID=A0A075UW26_9PSEU|nr:hypothetical protein [Amycolatopsis japonica]AIG77228.1 Hypothetical protein AJAP_21850 [Amycolatopsis japonica]